jgi:SAM-dependent methyltransferase
MSEIDKKTAYQSLFNAVLGSEAVWIVDIGLKAGLFVAVDAAGEGGVTAEALAKTLEFDEHYTEVWLRAAYAFQLIDWSEDGRYRMAANMKSLLLDSDDPLFIGGRMQFIAALYEDFKAYPSHLKSGATWLRSYHDPWLLEALKNTSKPDPVMITEHALGQSPGAIERLEGGGTIVDIGAGGGFAVSHYAARFPGARVIGLEFDGPSVELMRRTLADAGLSDRVEMRQADANELDEEDAWDVVTMNITLHETGEEPEWRNVLKRIHRALKPGGTVVISELPYPDSMPDYRSSPVYQVLAGVQIHEAIVGCGMITMSQLGGLLRDAGFTNARAVDQPMPTRYVMVGEK